MPELAIAAATPAAAPVAWDDADALARCTRAVRGPEGELAESVFAIEGIHCAACAPLLEGVLRAVPGVLEAEVNGTTRRARVRWQPGSTRVSALAGAIERAGYRARPAQAGEPQALRQREQRRALWRLFVAGFCMMQVMMYATPAYVAAPGEIAADIERLLRWASWLLSLPVVLFSAGPWLAGAWQALRLRRLGMDVPVALAIVVAFVVSTGATFAPGGAFGSEVYFDSLTMFVTFLLLGRWLELRARNATLGALDALVQRMPQMVERLRDDGLSELVQAGQLRAGDRVRVRPGQAFPADGVLEVGSSTQVDEALLTGESLPLARAAGAAVLAGSLNLAAPVTMRVERVGDDTRYAAIVALVERAAADRPALVRAADRVARPFLWGVLLLAAGAAAVWSTIDPAESVRVALAVLVVTCPCALSLAAPAALLSAAGSLARRGVLVQRLAALEALAQVDGVIFDKTGTVTEDRLALAAVAWAAGCDAARPRAEALALAQASLHPMARALCAAWSGEQPARLHALVEHAGQGVEGVDALGRRWRFGAAEFAAASAQDDGDGATAFLACDGALLARFVFEETLRADAAATVAALRDDGAEPRLLSGDRSSAVRRVAGALGIDRFTAGATPERKLAELTQLQAAGRRIAMVGDGINDAPVLARADVSVAMGQGADLARSRADFTLLSGRLSDLVAARRLARRTMAVLRQNLVWAALYNAACVPLALTGWLPPWAAGLGMAVSSLAVVLNAQRLRRG